MGRKEGITGRYAYDRVAAERTLPGDQLIGSIGKLSLDQKLPFYFVQYPLGETSDVGE
jgi:hypothetical protein